MRVKASWWWRVVSAHTGATYLTRARVHTIQLDGANTGVSTGKRGAVQARGEKRREKERAWGSIWGGESEIGDRFFSSRFSRDLKEEIDFFLFFLPDCEDARGLNVCCAVCLSCVSRA